MNNRLISSYPNDKSDTFAKIQQKYFGKQLAHNEEVTLTKEEFRLICEDSHELGRLRERALKSGSLGLR